MRYINQLEYPHMLYVTCTDSDRPDHEEGKTTTVKSSGCGLCSAIMVADRLLPEYDFELPDAIDLSYSVSASHRTGTDPQRFFPAFAKKLGLRLETGATTEELLRCLRTGGAAIVHVGCKEPDKPGLFTNSGHYMAVINEEPDGRLAILDPEYKEGKFDEPGQEGKVEIKNKVIALCDPAILHEETTMKPIPYYLFWRP